VALRLLYQTISTLLGWIVPRARCDTRKEIEILVRRHQLQCSDSAPTDRGSAGPTEPSSLPSAGCYPSGADSGCSSLHLATENPTWDTDAG
jgi:hypothetical protein